MTVYDSNGNDLDLSPHRVREVKPWCTSSLNVQSKAMNVLELESLKQGYPSTQKELVNRIRDKEIGSFMRGRGFALLVLKMHSCSLAVLPAVQENEESVIIGAREFF